MCACVCVTPVHVLRSRDNQGSDGLEVGGGAVEGAATRMVIVIVCERAWMIIEITLACTNREHKIKSSRKYVRFPR